MEIAYDSKQNGTFFQPEVYTFDEILEREDNVICDLSITSAEGPSWFEESIYPVNRFSELDPVPTLNQIELTKVFLDVLGHPNTVVSEGIPLKILAAVNLISDKIGYLSGREAYRRKTSNKRVPKVPRGVDEERVEKSVLKEACNVFYDSYVQARRVRFSPRQKRAYGFLEEVVLSVTEHTQAKIDFGMRYKSGGETNGFNDSHTDEQLVTIAMYLSAFENKHSGILTRDSDIGRILVNTLSFLSYQSCQWYKEILSSVKRNEIKVYYMTGLGVAKVAERSSDFNGQRRGKISPETLKRVTSGIMQRSTSSQPIRA